MIRVLWIFKRKKYEECVCVCVYFNSPNLLDNWYFLPTFMIQPLEDCSMKHQFVKYWFGKKKEQIHPGAGDKSEVGVLFDYNVSCSDMPPMPISPKSINTFCPHFLFRVLALGHSLVFTYCLFVYYISFCSASASLSCSPYLFLCLLVLQTDPRRRVSSLRS